MKTIIQLLSLVCAMTSCAAADQPRDASTESAIAELERSDPAQVSASSDHDYLLLERVRFLDTQGFDQPVEAFSLLVPKGWKSEGGAKWKSVSECRGELLTQWVSLTAPDGAISIRSLPARSFNWASDPMMYQALQAGAQAGGCEMSQPFTADQYLQHLATTELGGANITEVKPNNEMIQMLSKFDQQANSISQQYGNNQQQSSSAIIGKLKWPDGSQGSALINVTNVQSYQQDYMTGGTTGFSSTSVSYQVILKHAPGRKDEAERIFTTVISSYRQDPQWQKATSDFITQLGNIEHQGRMDRIRWMGEQARANAQEQSRRIDQQMRSWERSQASDDKQHKSFVQAIREVETWSDANGKVELSSGYDQAWSRGDGSYILSNSPGFDPSSVFQDQNWREMKRADP